MNLRRAARVVAGILLSLLALLGLSYLLMPDQLALWALQIERDRAGLMRHDIDVDGVHWAYLEAGSGPPLLLLHGLGADKDNWTRIAPLLVPHYRLIAPDLPGFGESSKPADEDYTVAAQTQRLAGFTAALHLERFDAGGSSMGGWIATTYAAAHPQAVHSLWLLDPGGVTIAQQRSELAARLKEGKPNPLFADTVAHFRDVVHFVFVHPPYLPGVVVRLLAHRQVDNYPLNLRIFKQIREDPMTLDRTAAGLTTPTLIVWGGGDRVAHPAGAEALHTLMPNSQVVVIPDVGHLPMVEVPKTAAADYLRFRDSLAP